jgi:hypothetical protein
MSAVLLGVVAVIAAGFGLALLDLTIRRAEVGAALVFCSAVIQAVFVFDVPSVRLGGARVGVTDLVATVVLAAALARCLRIRRFSRYQYCVIGLGCLLLVSLVLGIAQFGVQAAVNDFRQYAFFLGAALYMATFRPTVGLLDRIGRVWLVTALLMVLLACGRWLAVFGGIDLGIPAERYGVDTAIRVLDGPYAFFLAGPLLLTVPFWMRGGQPPWVRRAGVVLLIAVVALDRRTVWLAVLVGVALLLLRGRRLRARAMPLVVAASVVTVLAFTADVFARDAAPPGGATSTGSVDWRVEGWSDLVTSWSASPAHWIVGEPFGSGFARTVEGSAVTAHPHNFFIETMMLTGLGGLIALLALTFGLLRRLFWARPTGSGLFDPTVLAPLLAMQVVWYFTWIPGLEQGIVTGIAVAVAASASAPPPAVPAPATRPVRVEEAYERSGSGFEKRK